MAMSIFSNISLPSFSFTDRFRRISNSTSNIPMEARARGRRTAFSVVHFKKEKLVKQLETAILNHDVTMVEEVVGSVDVAELEDESLAFVMMACEQGDLGVLECLLLHDADPNVFGEGNYAPLHYAAKMGNLAMAQMLIAQGATVDEPTRYERKTPLHLAVWQAHVDVIELLLMNGANIQQGDLYGGQALHTACRMGRDDLIPLLLRHRAPIDNYDNEGWTGLHLAAEAGHTRVVKCLIRHNAHVDAQSRYGRTALHWACAGGHLAAVNELLTGNADANIRDLHDKLPLDYATSEATRTLVKLYTQPPDLHKTFKSTIGLLIQIDPRTYPEDKEAEFDIPKEATQKKWSSVIGISNEMSISSLPDEDVDRIQKYHRLREGRSSIITLDMLDTGAPTKSVSESSIVTRSFEHLSTSADREIGNLVESFKEFYSMMALASEANCPLNKSSASNAIELLSTVQDSLLDFHSKFRTQSEEFLNVMDKELIKKETKSGSPPYIALASMFTESILAVLGQHSDPDIWMQFLDCLRIKEIDVQDLLKLRLKLDTSLTLQQRLRHCIRFWSRACELVEDTDIQFMKNLLQSVEELSSGEENLVSDVLCNFVTIDMQFRTGSRFDKAASISQLVHSLRDTEVQTLIDNLEGKPIEETGISPVLDIIKTEPDSESDAVHKSLKEYEEQQEASHNLNRKLKEMTDDENVEELVMVVKFLILCGREDLLPYLL